MGPRGKVTQKEVAERLGVSIGLVNRLIKQGKLPAKGPDGYDLEACARAYAQTPQHPEISAAAPPQPEAPQSQGPTLLQAQTAKTAFSAQLAELKLQEQMGRVVKYDQVRVKWFNIARTVRNAMQAIPDRLAPLVISAKDFNEAHKMIAEEIDKVLQNLADNGRY